MNINQIKSSDERMEYEILCNFENLYKAHKKARLGKRNKKEVIEFELNLSANISRLQRSLTEKTYSIAGYKKFMIYDPKERQIQALEYRDRVVQHCFCDNILMAFLEKRLIYDNAACRLGKGSHFAMERLNKFLHEVYKKNCNNAYFLKCDIRKYFDSIDHQVLKDRLFRKIKDKDIVWLLNMIIDSFEKEPGKGLPMGNQTSQWFALYYLDGLDRLVKEKLNIRYYTRYMDDIIIVHESKDYLKECLGKMKNYVQDELKLSFNSKTQIFPVRNGVEYLGFRFYLTDSGKIIRRLRRSSKKRYIRRLAYLKRGYAKYMIPMESVTRSIVSYNGHFKHSNAGALKKCVMRTFSLRRDNGTKIPSIDKEI